ncbi:flagellar basal body P-ring formation chaperone FlgA [Acidisoma silvae]|uniref:Flagella basal body P-ring formation protein FlgA n=1 Tax=Acidisoma silvae TaxID=2802396 RepID=A0A963YQ85_9PROT|nr:flagellar basal body P-ring formation chaperone FlgA [Acidisoma silvae]MCB8874927.1 flagellar basal body P-ring formation protein FlgA [Acidisoma silvae]
MRQAAASLVLFCLAASGSALANASRHEDPSAVTSAVRQAAAQTAPAQAAITLGPVAAAQYMPACTVPLSVTISGMEPYQQAAVHCAAPIWTLYVSVTVDSRMAIVVAAQPIAGGSAITPDDVTLQDEPLSLYAGRQVYRHIQDVTGAIAVLSLPRGAILTSTTVQQPVVVQAGQTIAVDVRSGAVDVTLEARAEQSGRIGDSIMVANPTTGKRFQATVTPNGAVVQLGS